MKKILALLLSVGFGALVVDALGGAAAQRQHSQPRAIQSADNSSRINWEIGTFITPRDFPMGLFNSELMEEYYRRTARLGSYTGSMTNWFDADNEDLERLWQQGIADARAQGFKYVLESNVLSRDATTIGPPRSVRGSSFTKKSVRDAYRARVLKLAGFKPDVLLVAIEVNNLLFHENKKEFDAFKAFSRELYRAVKAAHPGIDISISFQLDHMRLRNEFDILLGFKGSLDIYSFSSYPTVFGVGHVNGIPGGPAYYSKVREHLPEGARVAMAESGWSSRGVSTESEQRTFYRRLPELYKGLRPEFVIISYLHDIPTPSGADANTMKFASMGLYTSDGKPKRALAAVLQYYKQ